MMSLADRTYKMLSILEGESVETVKDPVGRKYGGRHAYALSEKEDTVIRHVESECRRMFSEHRIEPDRYQITYDAFGNLFVTYRGLSEGPAVATGSHVDSVDKGGFFDGLSGVASSLVFLERLLESKEIPTRSFMLVAFRGEESAPVTGTPLLGSRIATGLVSPEFLDGIKYGRTPDEKIPLPDHFEQRYGEGSWSRVLDELKSPPITPERVALFVEVHPSQSRRLCEIGAEAGVVVGGIGGSRNSNLTVPREQIRTRTVSGAEQITVEVAVLGRPDHTGAAPHNTVNHKVSDEQRRLDALLGTKILVDELSKCLAPGDTELSWGVSSSRPHTFTGFTTVPHNQRTRFLVDVDKYDHFLAALQSAGTILSDSGMALECSPALRPSENERLVIDPYQMLAALQIPAEVEHIAATLAEHDEYGELEEISSRVYGGLVRATVTDFAIDTSTSLSMKMNLRIAGEAVGEILKRRIDTSVAKLLSSGFGSSYDEACSLSSSTPPAYVDPELVASIEELADRLATYAVRTSSIPGHDVAAVIMAGIRGCLIFLSDRGGSHVPTEQVDEHELEKAIELAHAVISRELGVTLKS